MKSLKKLALATLVAALPFAASAAHITVTPVAGSPLVGTGFNDFYGAANLSYTLANLSVDLSAGQTATATYTFLFKEAGFVNFLTGNPGEVFNTAARGTSITNTLTTGGVLPFKFTSQTAGVSVENGNNSTNEPDFAWSTMAPTSYVYPTGFTAASFDGYLLFSDTGAGIDRDYDDMIVGLKVVINDPPADVPVPGALALLGAGLLGLGVARRQKRA